MGWSQPFITDQALKILLPEDNARYSWVKRALKNKKLIRSKRGLYLLGAPYKKSLPNAFDMAQRIYGPSYISLESALSYHGLIPEGVYTTTSVSVKRKRSFSNTMGQFSFDTIPPDNFYLGVERVETKTGAFLMASKLKALADHSYVYKKPWKTKEALCEDLRVDLDELQKSDREEMKLLMVQYPSKRVQKMLEKLDRSLWGGY